MFGVNFSLHYAWTLVDNIWVKISTSTQNTHSNSSSLCTVLKNEHFQQSDGPGLDERLKPDEMSTKFGKIQNNLNCLLGNGRNQILTIPEIVAELLPRNYPELLDFDGSGRLVIFIPEWYLTIM